MPGYRRIQLRDFPLPQGGEETPDRVIVGSETLPKSLYRNWELVKALPNLAGDFMWTSWDYLGEAGIGTVRYTDKKTKQDTDPGLIISGGRV